MFLDMLSIAVLISTAIFIYLTFNNKIPFFSGVFYSAGAFVISFATSVISHRRLTGENIIEQSVNLSLDRMQEYMTVSPEMRELSFLLLPAMTILSALFFSYLIFVVTAGILRLMKRDTSMYVKFSGLKLPRSASTLLFLSMIFVMLSRGSQLAAVCLNASVIIGYVAMLCGLSVVCSFINTKVKRVYLRIIVYLALFLVILLSAPFASYILVMLALSDTAFNFRKIGVVLAEVPTEEDEGTDE